MLKTKQFWLTGLAGCAATISGTASATELNFSYASSFQPLQVTADWIQDSAPMPLSYNSGSSTTVAAIGSDAGLLFGITPVFAGNFTSVIFGSSLFGGGFSGADFAFDTGQQIYAGTEAAPIFSAGVFALQNGTLTITAVPEPASWAMLLVGFGVIGCAARRRRTVNVAYVFAGNRDAIT